MKFYKMQWIRDIIERFAKKHRYFVDICIYKSITKGDIVNWFRHEDWMAWDSLKELCKWLEDPKLLKPSRGKFSMTVLEASEFLEWVLDYSQTKQELPYELRP